MLPQEKKHFIFSLIFTGFKAPVLANQVTHLKMAILCFFHTAGIEYINLSEFLLRSKKPQNISSSSSTEKDPFLTFSLSLPYLG